MSDVFYITADGTGQLVSAHALPPGETFSGLHLQIVPTAEGADGIRTLNPAVKYEIHLAPHVLIAQP